MLIPKWGWGLIWRHYKSQKARPAIKWMNRLALAGVWIGATAWITVSSVMDGLQGERRDLIIKSKPHLFWEGAPRPLSDFSKKNLPPQLSREIQNTEFLLQTEALLELPSDGNYQGKTLGSGVVLRGTENLGNKVILGRELSDYLNVVAGDEIRLRNAWKLELEPLDLFSAGLFETGQYDIDRLYVKVDQSTLEKWMGLPQSFNRLEFKLKNPYLAAQLKSQIEKHYGLNFKTWNEADSALWYSLKLEKTFMNLAMIFVSLLAALSVHLALSVRVVDKSREIGLLMALGADSETLSLMYLFEGAFLGIVGSIGGLLLSYFLCHVFSGYFKFPSFYYSTQIPIDWNWGRAIAMALITTLVATLASWMPAKRVTHTQVQDALRS